MAGCEFEILTYNWDPPYNEGLSFLLSVELTENEFQRLCNAHLEYVKGRSKEPLGFLAYSRLMYFPPNGAIDILSKVREAIIKRAVDLFGDNVLPHINMDETDIIVPKEIWELSKPYADYALRLPYVVKDY